MSDRFFRRIFILLTILVLVGLACSLPTQSPPVDTNPVSDDAPIVIEELPPTATLPPPPTPTAQPLPPTLVEADPPPGGEIPLQGALTFYFDQPMDRGAVEGALVGEPPLSGRLNWLDDATLVFEPDTALPPATDVTIEVSATALAANGLAMLAPVRISYRTAAPLQAIQILPPPGTVEADPHSAIVATFNQPVVPLGADAAALPAAFSVAPALTGDGEWVNTSTYIFYPAPPMLGGTSYTVSLNPDLRSTSGGPFTGIVDFEGASWSFSTALPRLQSAFPAEGTRAVPLDTVVELKFNQAMNTASVQENFVLRTPDHTAVAGTFGWDADFSTMVFTPTHLLARDQGYTIFLSGAAQSQGGSPLGVDHSQRFFTVPAFYVSWTEPGQGGRTPKYQGAKFYLSAPVDLTDPLKYVTVSPAVTNLSYWVPQSDFTLNINGDFKPDTAYQVTLAGALPDRWGQSLGQDYVLRFRTQPLQPILQVAYGEPQIFITPQDLSISAQATSIRSVDLSSGRIPADQIWQYLGPVGYDALNNAYLPDAQNWTQPLDVSNTQLSTVRLPLTPDDSPLPPGVYHYRVTAQEFAAPASAFLLISSNVHLTFKLSATQAFVWAVDLRDGTAVADQPITIYDFEGHTLASGMTDGQGVFQIAIPAKPDIYGTYYALIGNPGEAYFSLAFSSWNSGLQGYDFGIQADYRGPRTQAYLYTDRPIYRPGQTVYFRTIVRHARNGRYTLPDIGILPVAVTDGNYQPLLDLELPLSEYGTAHGQFTLGEAAVPGYYTINTPHGAVTFQVAAYRKPEIDLAVSASPNPAIFGQMITVDVAARYFFDAPAGDVPLNWNIQAVPQYFSLPGYATGAETYGWLLPPYLGGFYGYGQHIAAGEGRTGPNGQLTIEIPTRPGETAQRYLIEVTLQDESGFPVSRQAEVVLHPADFYIGARPDTWVGVAGDEISFEIKIVDWDQNPAGNRDLTARFQKITWVRRESDEIYAYPTFEPAYTPVSSSNFRTGHAGLARLAFTPPEPGTYELEIRGDGALTQLVVWVGGPGQVSWPNLPNQQLTLTPDREAYAPGETAKIFIPNPLGAGAQALVTIERGEVLHHQVLAMDASGFTFALPLTEVEAPNVYFAVTLIGAGTQGQYDFRQGFLNLEVAPRAQTLQVQLTPLPTRVGPQDEVSFTVRVTDEAGSPLQGEFSLAIVDQAVLALADPFEPGIVEAFYGMQPLGVRTGLSLAAYAHRFVDIPGGLGGGGGDMVPLAVRDEFLDTAYWNAEIITDANGEATISLTLPDNLTTWVASARGLTVDSRVGEAEVEVVATKDLLVRPVTPRFLVTGDHLRLMGIVHNNTANDLTVDVRLQSAGFVLDDPGRATQRVTVPAGGRYPVSWWGTVEAVDVVDLVFFVEGGGFTDAARPLWGDLPVQHYHAPQTFGTAGTLTAGGERLEVVSLPRTYDPNGGDLQVELAPSLAAAMLPGLDVLEHYPYECTEQTLSRFLPNLETYRAVQSLGLEAPDFAARLDRTLNVGLQRLAARQHEDGGWGWWPSTPALTEPGSDPYISAYVLFGLSRARAAGIFVDELVFEQAVNFSLAALPAPEMLTEPWQLDRLAFQLFALSQAGAGSPSGIGILYEARGQLSPWAQAFLALALETISPGDPRIREIYADLEAGANRSATGTHWEGHAARINLETPVFTSAVVVYALAQHDPASPTLPEAVRYLMAARGGDGAWGSTYETAWVILALTQVMQGTGELAGDFGFSATLNGMDLIESAAGGDAKLNPVSAAVPVEALYPQDPNALILQRGEGPGILYYTAHLNVVRPVEDIGLLDQGIHIDRFYETAAGKSIATDMGWQAAVGQPVFVRVALTLKQAVYYLAVEDYIPAGAEILDARLNTSQQISPVYDPRDPFGLGWGWWYFNDPQVYDARIAWSVDYLPAGTYELTYMLVLNQPGAYRVLPARAWAFYFPEVQGHSAGAVFTIGE